MVIASRIPSAGLELGEAKSTMIRRDQIVDVEPPEVALEVAPIESQRRIVGSVGDPGVDLGQSVRIRG